MNVRLGRTYRFFAAHRLHTPKLSDAENAALYGKCNHPNGHGHTYMVDVIVEGPLDDRTSMVMDLADLDGSVESALELVAYKYLDRDVGFFQAHPSTTEHVVQFLHQQIQERLPADGPRLVKVEVAETRNNRFEAEGTSA